MLWGWFISGVFLYQTWGAEFKQKPFVIFVIFAGAVLFPLSKWVVEFFSLKFTSRDFWSRGLFIDTPAKMGLIAMYHGFVFVFSVPIVALYFFIALIKMLMKK